MVGDSKEKGKQGHRKVIDQRAQMGVREQEAWGKTFSEKGQREVASKIYNVKEEENEG